MNRQSIYLFLLLLLSSYTTLFAQENITADTSIYLVADIAPRFPGCEQLDTTEAVIKDCAQKSLLGFIYENVRYPLDARRQNIEGTVVASFVIEKDGTISSPEIIKDIGGGCGPEVMRVVGAMNGVGIRWKPGIKNSSPVRTRFNLPVKFRLEEAPDYVLVGRDSVYTTLDSPVSAKEGDAAIEKFIAQSVETPASMQDSCFVGYMDITLLVFPDESVKVMNVQDYTGLGFDFQFEAIRVANATIGMWQPGTRKGRNVSAVIDLRVPFQSNKADCKSVTDNFFEAEKLAAEGSQLYNEGKTSEGLAKLSKAIELFGNNADFRYLRGQAYLAEKNYEAACADFAVVRQILSNSPVESIYPLLCK